MRKITIELIQKEIDQKHFGSKLITKKYINAKQKLHIKCNNDHDFTITYDSLNKNNWCQSCKDRRSSISYNIKDVENFINKHHPGSTLLSNNYKNLNTILELTCEKGHNFKMKFSAIKKGYWCKHCSGKAKKTIEDVKDYLKAYHPNSELISKEYINAFAPLTIKCEKGHEFISSWHKLSKNWCFECRGTKKPTLENIQSFLDQNHLGAKLLSTTYKNNHTKLKFVCEKGHKYNASWASVKNGSWCFECNGTKPPTLKYIQEFLNEKHSGAKLLSKTYKNAFTKLDVICNNGHKIKIGWNSLKKGKWCMKCSGNEKKTIKDVISFIESHYPGSKLLSKKYENNFLKLKFKCEKGHVFYKSWSGIKRSWCPYCSESSVEYICRNTFEKYFKKSFPKVRLDCLRNPKTKHKLELDGFNEELKLAFECDGAQHYYFPNDFHHTKKDFLLQQERDKIKNDLCKINNIKLIRIKAFNFGNVDKFINQIKENLINYTENI